MESLNFSVVSALEEWLQAGDQVFFATIISTWGASPRPPGSLFTYNASREIQLGSLSGGCIEDALLEDLKSISDAEFPLRLTFGESEEEAKRLQLPCGGSIVLLVEQLKQDSHGEHFTAIRAALESRQRIKRLVSMHTGQLDLLQIDQHYACNDSISLQENRLEHILGPAFQLLIVGASEVAKFLIPIVQAADFYVELCDSREMSMTRHRVDTLNVPTHLCLADDLVRDRFADKFSAVVALAHDPRVDDLAIMEALQSECFFVGAMGSERTSDNRVARLRELGFTTAQLTKLKAPIGLSIHSKTPAEIAVSIAAQLIEERYKTKSKTSNQ